MAELKEAAASGEPAFGRPEISVDEVLANLRPRGTGFPRTSFEGEAPGTGEIELTQVQAPTMLSRELTENETGFLRAITENPKEGLSSKHILQDAEAHGVDLLGENNVLRDVVPHLIATGFIHKDSIPALIQAGLFRVEGGNTGLLRGMLHDEQISIEGIINLAEIGNISVSALRELGESETFKLITAGQKALLGRALFLRAFREANTKNAKKMVRIFEGSDPETTEGRRVIFFSARLIDSCTEGTPFDMEDAADVELSKPWTTMLLKAMDESGVMQQVPRRDAADLDDEGNGITVSYYRIRADNTLEHGTGDGPVSKTQTANISFGVITNAGGSFSVQVKSGWVRTEAQAMAIRDAVRNTWARQKGYDNFEAVLEDDDFDEMIPDIVNLDHKMYLGMANGGIDKDFAQQQRTNLRAAGMVHVAMSAHQSEKGLFRWLMQLFSPAENDVNGHANYRMTLRAFVQESGDANVRKAYNKYLFDTNEENKNTFRAAVEALPEENAHVRRALLELVDIQGQYRDHAANRIMADIVDVYQKAAGGTDGARTFRLLRRILDDNFDGGFERKTMARITTHSELLGLLGNIKWVTCKSGVDRTSFSVNVSNAIELTRQNLAHTPGLEAMPVEIYNRIVDNIHELKTLRRNPGEAGFAEYLARAQAIGSAGDFHTNYNDVDAVLNAISNAYVADVEMQSKPTQIFSTLLPGNKTGSGGFFAWITGGMNLIGLVFWPTGRPVAGFQVLGKYRGS